MNVDKLSSTDRVFFDIEGGALMMHLGALMVFEGGDLVSPAGALDAARLTRLLEAGIAEVPRFRQVVRKVPGLGAVWVDDEHYRLGYHVRHTAVPHPGDDAQLMALAGMVFSQPLDRRHPLWEAWLIEGLSGGRFAVILKVHHAMVDGVGGIGLLASILRVAPGDRLRYVFDEGGVRIEKGAAAGDDDPFATFSEWSSEADEHAYRDL